MSARPDTRPVSRRTVWLLAAAAGLVLLAAANAHLVYVAVASQPDCVPHLKEAGGKETGGGQTFRAARPSC